MAVQFQPPPTYADPVIYDDKTRRQQFNPIWLKWFLDVAQYISVNGGGGAIKHNSLGGLQGGDAPGSEYYHLTNNAYKILGGLTGPTAGSVAYGTGSALAFSTVGTAGQVLTSAGAGAPVWSSLSGTTVTSFSGGTTGLTPNTPTTGAIVLGGTLVIANGGTNGSATPTAGALAYGTGSAYAFTAAGTSGYFIKSAGAGTPVWSNSIGGYIVDGTTPYLDWANGSAVTLAAGRMWYNGSTGSWNLGMGNGNITQQVGEETFIYGKASAAITDSPLQIIYKTGTVGASGVIQFAPAIGGITDPDQILGVATEDIALNGFGRITTFGVVHGITTNGTAFGETWANNDDIWYNPTTGNPTKVKPSAPGIKLRIGTVINAGSGGSGSFFVKLGSSSALGGTDSNVQFGALANNNLIQYSTTLGYWTNVAASSIAVGTATNLSGGAAGSVPYQTGAGATTFLDIGSALQVLKVNAGATAPEWVSGAALTKTDDTNVTLTLGGTPATSLLAATSLTLGWTGQLAVSRGGTGVNTTPANGQLLIGNGTGYTVANISAGSNITITNTAGGISIASSNPGGTVTSVGLSMPTQFAVTNSPVTSSGTLTAAWNNQTANYVLAGPTTGAAAAPTFRALVAADIPSLSYVSSVSGTSPVVSSGGTTPAISLASGYGDTQNPYASKTANYVLAAPNGSAGVPTFRALVAADVPALPYQPTAAPVTYTANFSVATTDVWIINNKSGSSCTATLPTASSYSGRTLYFINYQVQTLVSASSNVVPLTGGAAGTAILSAVAGDTCTLVSNGTNWVMTQYTPNNVLLLE